MKSWIQIAFLLTPILGAQDRPASSATPALIDRELLFAKPEISAAQLSPDGKFVTFVKPWQGIPNLWIKRSGDPASAARPLTTNSKYPVFSYLWTSDGKSICFVKAGEPDGSLNLYALEPEAVFTAGSNAPTARDLTHLTGAEIRLYGNSKSDPDELYIGLNDLDETWPSLYKLKVSTAGRTLLRENTDRVSGWFFDAGGALRLAYRTSESGEQELLRVDPKALTKIYSCGAVETCTPLRFHKDGKRVYLATNKGASLDLSELALLDLATGKTEAVESDPLRRVDFGSAGFSEATGELAYTTYLDDRQRSYFKDKEFEADFKWIGAQLAGKDFSLGSATRDNKLWLINAFGDTEPGETYVFHRQARTLALQFRVQETLPRASLAAMQPVRYKSSDGLEIPAYLILPQSDNRKDLPAVVLPHGGLSARDSWGYNAMAQFLANRGYAVLMPNFRSSAGYGKKFLAAGNGEWGRKMQDDLTWGVRHLVAAGIADPKRVAIVGATSGGYAVLAGVAFTPDLYRAAVDIAGPVSLFTMLDSIPSGWESVRKTMYARTADPATAEGRAWLKERSPINEAARIKTPLLVVQGARDTQVTKAEADQLVATLRDHGVPVEYLLAPDEGHGFARPVNYSAMLAAVEAFLAKNLGGRYQQDASPEVTSRLAAITVDPAKVTAEAKGDSPAPRLPNLAADLKPGYYRYQAKLSLGDKSIPLKMATIIEEKDGAWTATEIVETPKGASSDTAVLEKGTLAVRKRGMKQGEATIDIDFGGERAAGKIIVNGQERSISAPLGGPLFADAAGSLQSVGCLPLADGFTLTYRNFDVQRQKARMMQLKVTGTDSVTVPAGTFEAFRVEIFAAGSAADKDKATVWIAKDSRQPVKMVTVSSAMNGATMTAELLQ